MLAQWHQARVVADAPIPEIADALVHQGTRFGGAAESLPIIVAIAADEASVGREYAVQLVSRLGAKVEPELAELEFDRERLSRVRPSEVGDDEIEVLDALAAMWASDARSAWIDQAAAVSILITDSDPKVALAALVAFEDEIVSPPRHQERLRKAADDAGQLGWHALLALGFAADVEPLESQSEQRLRAELSNGGLRSVCAAVALARESRDADVLRALRRATADHAELSKHTTAFERPLMGMVEQALG